MDSCDICTIVTAILSDVIIVLSDDVENTSFHIGLMVFITGLPRNTCYRSE